jgi:hypothetical protein
MDNGSQRRNPNAIKAPPVVASSVGTPPVPPPKAYVEPPPLQLPSIVEVPEQTPSKKWFSRVPAWLVSLIVHVAAILILACIPLVRKIAVPFIISGTYGKLDETVPFEISNLANDSFASLESTSQPDMSIASTIQIDPPDDIEPIQVGVGLTIKGPEPSLGFSGRGGALRSALLAAYGGTKGTEDAVKEGLAWLAKQQRGDGSWSLTGPYQHGGIQENKVAATAMALIAFAGAGHTHRAGDFQLNVEKGLKYLLKLQDSEGFFCRDAPDRHQMYSQAQATIVLGELLGMTADDTLRKPLRFAIEFAEQSQGREGGWRYIPREDSDTSVTGWYVMALMSGQMAGISTDPKVLEKVRYFLDSVQSDNGSRYAYTSLSNRLPSFSMTAEGLLCREYLGWKHDDPRLIRGCESLCEQLVTVDPAARSYYFWYYATQTLHHFGGEPWRIWNDAMRVELPKLQIREGKERGSWPPQNDDHSSAGGRLYATCFAIYCLEVYYRHLPLYGLKK